MVNFRLLHQHLRGLSPPDDLLLAVVFSPLDGSGHLCEGAEPRLSGHSIGGQGLQAAPGCQRLLQGGQTSEVLPPEQTQRVLQVPLPQGCLPVTTPAFDIRVSQAHSFTSSARLGCSHLPPEVLGELLQVLQAEQRLLQSSLSFMFRSLQQSPAFLYVTQGLTFTQNKPLWGLQSHS